MATNITLRSATPEDLPTLVAVFASAFRNSPFTHVCFPESDPSTEENHYKFIGESLPDILCAVDPASGVIHGWCRWTRRPAAPYPPANPIVVSKEVFPAGGDQDLARRFFQANVDNSGKILQGREHWFLSYIVVKQESKGMGVGKVMMQYGTARADEDGLIAYVNGSREGKGIYEKFGFKTVEVSDFGGGVTTWHMLRDAKPASN